MHGFSFEYPWVLALGLLFVLCHFFCRARYERFYIPHLSFVRQSSKAKDSLLPLLKWFGVVFLLLSLASPVQNRGWIANESESVDIVLTLDLSGSMRYPISATQTRFDALVDVVSEFIEHRRGDRLGIVSFASFSAVSVPLTFDTDLVQDIFNRLYIGVVGERTALYDSILQTYMLLEESNAKSKVVVLFTDGINNEGTTPLEVVKEVIASSDVVLYTIGLGVVDELELKEFAALGGGQYFKADNKRQLQQVYHTIDTLERSSVDGDLKKLQSYYFVYTLFIALLCFLFYLYLKNQRGIQ